MCLTYFFFLPLFFYINTLMRAKNVVYKFQVRFLNMQCKNRHFTPEMENDTVHQQKCTRKDRYQLVEENILY